MKMTYLFISAMLCALTSLTSAQPRIGIAPTRNVDWGNVSEDILNTTVTLCNVGTQTLTIAEIRTSCGCTTAPFDKKVLSPGDTTILRIRVDVHDKSGQQKKEVYVVTNDPLDSVAVINLRAFLARELKPDPLMFPAKLGVKLDSEYETDINIYNISEDIVTLKQPEAHLDGVQVRFDALEGIQIAPGASEKVRAFVTPKQSGYSTAKVHIATSGKYNSAITVDLACFVQDAAHKPKFTQGAVVH